MRAIATAEQYVNEYNKYNRERSISLSERLLSLCFYWRQGTVRRQGTVPETGDGSVSPCLLCGDVSLQRLYLEYNSQARGFGNQ